MTTLPKEIENWKKTILKPACAKCDGHCCSTNLPDLTQEQVQLLFGNSDPEAIKDINGEHIVLPCGDGTFVTSYEQGGHCPQLENGMCKVYNHPLKPKVCGDFPFFLEEEKKILFIHNFNCPVTEDLKNISRLCKTVLDLGYKIENMCGLHKEVTEEDLVAPLAQLKFEENLARRKVKKNYPV